MALVEEGVWLVAEGGWLSKEERGGWLVCRRGMVGLLKEEEGWLMVVCRVF